MAEIKDAILDYINHFEDLAHFEFVFAYETQSVMNSLVELLQREDYDPVSRTCLFIQDAITIAAHWDIGLEFRDVYHVSEVVRTMERLVLSRNHHIRGRAVYTLAKTGCAESVPALRQAFVELRDTDPLFLPDLVSEIRWLDPQGRNRHCKRGRSLTNDGM